MTSTINTLCNNITVSNTRNGFIISNHSNNFNSSTTITVSENNKGVITITRVVMVNNTIFESAPLQVRSWREALIKTIDDYDYLADAIVNSTQNWGEPRIHVYHDHGEYKQRIFFKLFNTNHSIFDRKPDYSAILWFEKKMNTFDITFMFRLANNELIHSISRKLNLLFLLKQ